MDWMDHNLDAYRDVAEILTTLRATTRRQLEGAFGRNWHHDGVPPEVLERMIVRKERERAIDWHESEYQEIINYSSFIDILEIIEDTPELFGEIAELAPSTAMLHTRFLELDVISQKIAMARPISENELGFLGTFHIRFRKAVDQLRSRPVPEPTPKQRPASTRDTGSSADEASAQDAKTAKDAKNAKNAKDAAAIEVQPPEPASKPHASAKAVAAEPAAAEPATAEVPAQEDDAAPDAVTRPNTTAPETDRKRPPMRAVSGAGGAPAKAASTPAAADSIPGGNGNGSDPDAEQTDDTETEPAELVNVLDHALERSDSTTILRELYREVTNIAEGIWTSQAVPQAMVWPKVVDSPWYEHNFSTIGLKPLSDFYEVRMMAEQRAQAGASKGELQEFLKECNFAKTLLAMRDMFQKHHI